MKKSLLVLAALAALSMAFVSCGGGAGGGDSKPVNNDGPKEVVILDPASYTGSVGEVVEIGGTKYVKVTTDQYNTTIPVDPVADVAACKTVSGTAYAESTAGMAQFVIQLMNAENKLQAASFPYNPPVAEATAKESAIGPGFDWIDYNDGQKAKKGVTTVAGIQIYAQDSSWQPLDGAVIYVGKIVAK